MNAGRAPPSKKSRRGDATIRDSDLSAAEGAGENPYIAILNSVTLNAPYLRVANAQRILSVSTSFSRHQEYTHIKVTLSSSANYSDNAMLKTSVRFPGVSLDFADGAEYCQRARSPFFCAPAGRCW